MVVLVSDGKSTAAMQRDDFMFYFGASSGSSRKALRILNEPNVMLNYATKNNTPWDGIDRLFIDSGGYSFMKGMGEFETSDDEYIDFIEEHDPELFALRDYPCEPEVLEEHDRTISEHQRRTTERHRSLWDICDDRDVDAERLSVLQGWAVGDYLDHLDDLRDYGVLSDYVGIGSVCRRNRETEIRRIILSVREALPSKHDLHAFGVKSSVLKHADVADALASADSQSYEMQAQWGTLRELGAGKKTWRDSAFEYLRQRRRLQATLARERDRSMQTTLAMVGTEGNV